MSNTVIIKITTNNYYLIFSKTPKYMLISLNACIVYLSIIITRGCCILFSSLAYPLNAICDKWSTSHVLCLKRYWILNYLALSNYNLISWWRIRRSTKLFIENNKSIYLPQVHLWNMISDEIVIHVLRQSKYNDNKKCVVNNNIK